MIRKLFLFVILLLLGVALFLNPNFKTISAGVAILLFGMIMLEEGFRTFTKGPLQKILRNATNKLYKSIPVNWASQFAYSSHDISVPLSSIPDFITQGTQAIAALGPFRVNCFGHVGDGNLHYNVFPLAGKSRDEHAHQRDEVTRIVHDLVAEFDGSFSAEHGIGRMKVEDLNRYGDPTKLATMRAIKVALDPKGIMNPGAVISG